MKASAERRRPIYNLSLIYIAFLLLWSLVEIWSIVTAMLTQRYFVQYRGTNFFAADFVHLYKCGKIVCTTPHLLYDFSTQMAWLKKLMAPGYTNPPIFSPYTPPMCLLMGLLSLCPIFWAWSIWMLATGILAFYSLWRLLSDLGYLLKTERVLFLVGVFSSIQNWMTMLEGQCSWFILAMGTLFISCFLKKRDFLAGFYLSLLAIKPQYALFLVIPPLAAKRYKIVASAIFCGALQYVLAGMVLGWQTVLQYPKAILFDDEQILQKGYTCGPEQMICLRAFFALLSDSGTALHISSILMVVALVFLFVLWRRVNNYSLAIVYSCFSLTVVLALLLSPHVFSWDAMLLAIPAALTLKTLNLRDIAQYSPTSERRLYYTFIAYPALILIGGLIAVQFHKDMVLVFTFLHGLILALLATNLRYLVLHKPVPSQM